MPQCDHEWIIEAQEKQQGEFFAYRLCTKCKVWFALGKVEFTLLSDYGLGLHYEPIRHKKLYIMRDVVSGQEPMLGKGG